MVARQPVAQRQKRGGNLVMASARAVLFDQRGRRLAESTGMNLDRQSLDPALLVELHRQADPAPACRRAQLRPAVFAFEFMRLLERSRKPQDFGRVQRLRHSRRQVVPPGPSSKMMPSALSSSRMRSAVAKSRAFFAAVRSAMRDSITELL